GDPVQPPPAAEQGMPPPPVAEPLQAERQPPPLQPLAGVPSEPRTMKPALERFMKKNPPIFSRELLIPL
ncbi:hypothetical protein TorRG33x02_035070, partial [Trema orientale]